MFYAIDTDLNGNPESIQATSLKTNMQSFSTPTEGANQRRP